MVASGGGGGDLARAFVNVNFGLGLYGQLFAG